ncbi:MAG: hypothetical protein VW647_03550 [Alphaproteobacteria bacterium]
MTGLLFPDMMIAGWMRFHAVYCRHDDSELTLFFLQSLTPARQRQVIGVAELVPITKKQGFMTIGDQ